MVRVLEQTEFTQAQKVQEDVQVVSPLHDPVPGTPKYCPHVEPERATGIELLALGDLLGVPVMVFGETEDVGEKVGELVRVLVVEGEGVSVAVGLVEGTGRQSVKEVEPVETVKGVFGGQLMHVLLFTAPTELEKVPFAQGVQGAAAPALAHVPAGHVEQEPEEGEEEEPAGHRVHESEPAGENVPALQGKQLAPFVLKL